MNFTLNIYDKKGIDIIKTYESKPFDLRFGTIRKLMELLKIEDMKNQAELLKLVYSAYEQITEILGEVFPECQEDEWDNVKVSELLPLLINIAKYAVSSTFVIPKDNEKN